MDIVWENNLRGSVPGSIVATSTVCVLTKIGVKAALVKEQFPIRGSAGSKFVSISLLIVQYEDILNERRQNENLFMLKNSNIDPCPAYVLRLTCFFYIPE